MSNIRRLFFDIESAPNIGLFWSAGYKLNIPHENIIKERAIICIAYKWSDQKKVYCLQWDKNQNDKQILKDFLKVADQADELIGHNGDNFDLKWIRTRCYYHGIPMMPSYVTIDTLKEARKGFRFNSNKLDYISKYSGGAGKNHTSFDLWRDIVLKKSKASMKIMTDYCKIDVVRLEEVFNKMSKYIKHKTSIAEYKCNCPGCNSKNMKVRAHRISSTGSRHVQLQCHDCGKYHNVPASVYGKEVEKRDYAAKKKHDKK
jgi:DNA polymerase elongation subunit (family B)